MKRKTSHLGARQRAANIDFNVRHAITIAHVRGRLLGHAARCRREKGYRGLDGMNRNTCAIGLSGLAGKLGERIDMRLSCVWWADRAISILQILDRRNPT